MVEWTDGETSLFWKFIEKKVMFVEILVYSFISTAFLIICWLFSSSNNNKSSNLEEPKAQRADEQPKCSGPYDSDKWIWNWKDTPCQKCEHFDGYDVCLCKYHWGTVTNQTLNLCYKRTDGFKCFPKFNLMQKINKKRYRKRV